MHRHNRIMLQWAPELVLALNDDFAGNWQSTEAAAGTEHMCRIAAQANIPVLPNGAQWLGAAVQLIPKRSELTPEQSELAGKPEHNIVGQAEWGTTRISAPVSIVFPKIAAEIACRTVRNWLGSHTHSYRQVLFVCFDQDNVGLYAGLCSEV